MPTTALMSDLLPATSARPGGALADELVEPLRLMRGYGVRFLERIGATEDRRDPQASSRHLFREHRWRMHD
jgi:hypothetical protein